MRHPKPKFASEKELAGAVDSYLRGSGWDTYFEVAPWASVGARADIVAVKGPVPWIIETKLALSLDVMEQAMGWRGYGHYVSVATPQRRPGRFTCHVARTAGVGIMAVRINESSIRFGSEEVTRSYEVEECVHAPINRRADCVKTMRKALAPEQKTAAQPGATTGGYWTPYARTCREILRIVTERPGLTIKQLIENEGLEHHYQSTVTAKSPIAHCVRIGVVPDVEARMDGRFITLWPKGYSIPPKEQASLVAQGAA